MLIASMRNCRRALAQLRDREFLRHREIDTQEIGAVKNIPAGIAEGERRRHDECHSAGLWDPLQHLTRSGGDTNFPPARRPDLRCHQRRERRAGILDENRGALPSADQRIERAPAIQQRLALTYRQFVNRVALKHVRRVIV